MTASGKDALHPRASGPISQPGRVAPVFAAGAVGLFVVATAESWAWLAYSWGVLPIQMWWFLDNGGSNGLLPENVGAVLVRSAAYLAGFVLMTAASVLAVRHRRALATFRLTVVLSCLAVVIGFTPWVSSALFPGTSGLTHRDAVRDFHTLRPALDRVVERFADNGQRGIHVELPASLRFVSVMGNVDVSGSEQAGDLAIFVPEWAALVDDAGGYFYSPTASPAGYDMRGMTCADPTPLEGGWWMCGMS
ncbi:hypothetical protein ACFWEJ_26130 [Promicromonospora sp. NPDC060204]|uniref:hypothetical protein n=1 Tax=Promicromonospora sp. NPDC060204 TaxID=3347071 RepID=UPI00365189A6